MQIHFKSLTVALAAMVSASGPAMATATFGSLGNFDAVNDTGKTAHGFEIELEGIHAGDVTDTFGGAGRGFPTTVERYGAPTITEYSNGSVFGVRVTYRADLTGPSSGWIGTPSGVYSTPGESCWTGGGSGYGPATPCDHFGVGLIQNPTRTSYNWLVEDSPGSSTLVYGISNVLAPTWTVTPQAPAPGNPNPPPPIVAAQIVAPEHKDAPNWEFGEAIWAKVFTTEIEGDVILEDLVGGNPVIDQAESNTEIEWQLLQKEFNNPLSGILENGGAAAVGDHADTVIRRYEFYAFTGLYDDETHEALFDVGFGDSNPGPNDVGNFIGAQNAALNFNLVLAGAVPEPASWAMMVAGLGLIGGTQRRRKAAVRFA
jgi:hypothetical protein